jgi:hypothetical protein
MHGQHHAFGLFPIHAEKAFQNLDDEIHWCVVVIHHYHLVHGWFLDLWPDFFDHKIMVTFRAAGLVFPALAATIWKLVNENCHALIPFYCPARSPATAEAAGWSAPGTGGRTLTGA